MRTACCSGRPARSGMLPTGADRGGLTFRVPPTGAVLGTAAIAFIADQVAPERSPRPRRPSGTRCRSWTTSTVGRWPQGAEHELRARGLHDVGSFGYDFRTVDMAKLVAADRRRASPTCCSSRRTSRTRSRCGASWSPSTCSCSRTSARRRATACRRSAPRWARTRSACSRRTSRRASTINPAGLRPRRARPAATRERRVRRGVVRGHEPRRARRLLGGVGVLHRRPAGGGVARAGRRRRGRAGDRPAAAGACRTGAGCEFGAPGTPDAGDNLAAASVIWEWVAPGEAAVIWPPAFATQPMDPSASDAW